MRFFHKIMKLLRGEEYTNKSSCMEKNVHDEAIHVESVTQSISTNISVQTTVSVHYSGEGTEKTTKPSSRTVHQTVTAPDIQVVNEASDEVTGLTVRVDIKKTRHGRRGPYTKRKEVRDYALSCDGKKVKRGNKYILIMEESASVDKDISQEMLLRAEYLDELDEVCFGNQYWQSPDAEQIETYYALCRQCQNLGINYNRRDRPESYQEYYCAIRSLKRAIKNRKAASD